jgi:hypothetical protein
MTSAPLSKRDSSPQELQHYFLTTYMNIRLGIALIGIAFPFVLWFGGQIYARLPLQASMSAYYHAAGYGGRSMRDWFVGLLFTVGIFLYLYKGFSRAENWALNMGGALAVGVAIFPMPWNTQSTTWLTLHGFCAIGLFFCIAIVALFCSDETLDLIYDTNIRNPARVIARLKFWYRVIGLAMIVSMLLAYSLNTVLKTNFRVFWVETAGISSFSAYWLLKSWELRRTAAEMKTALGQMKKIDGKLMSIASEPRLR